MSNWNIDFRDYSFRECYIMVEAESEKEALVLADRELAEGYGWGNYEIIAATKEAKK